MKTEQSRNERKQEIIDSRKGGFGGSDADMFARVGLNGLSVLTDTDKKRIAVALGQIEYVPIQPTEAMERGNDFEDFVAQFLIKYQASGCKREAVIEKKLARNFRTFAHADFYFEDLILSLKRSALPEHLKRQSSVTCLNFNGITYSV